MLLDFACRQSIAVGQPGAKIITTLWERVAARSLKQSCADLNYKGSAHFKT